MALTRIILLGPPGSGKGTQAKRLSDAFHMAHISTGDMLREARAAGTELGRKAGEYMDAGQLVPDDVVIGLVKERLQRPDCSAGFVLDGFPRTVAQAEALDQAGANINCVIDIDVDDEEVVRRLGGRRSCPSCGRVYHVEVAPSRDGEHCDACGASLVVRPDDQEDTIRARLKVYHEKTAPLTRYYKDKGLLKTVRSEGGPDAVFRKVLEAIGAHGGEVA